MIDSIHKQKPAEGKPVYETSIRKPDKFSIVHSAEKVEYDIKQFIERNIDNILDGLEYSMTTYLSPQTKLIYKACLTEEDAQ